MKINYLPIVDISPLEEILLREGKIIPAPYDDLKKFSQDQLSTFCVKHGVYQIPTIELIGFLMSEIPSVGSVIEIGAGNGCIGRALGIRMADNKMQQNPMIKAHYAAIDQPTVNYGDDVEKIDGNEAVKKYRPKTVIACWLTDKLNGNMFGVDESRFFKDGVTKYIHIGNEGTHGNKRILKTRNHKKLKFPWLLSRSLTKDDNVIYVFGGK
jgi:hypothetical protein